MFTRDYDLDHCLLVLTIDIYPQEISQGWPGMARDFRYMTYRGILNRVYGIWKPKLGLSLGVEYVLSVFANFGISHEFEGKFWV